MKTFYKFGMLILLPLTVWGLQASYPTKSLRDLEWSYFLSSGIDNWEVAWEGDGSPANLSLPYHLWWDNPHDDDMNANPAERGACKFRFNDPIKGQMTVNRINTKDGSACPVSATGYSARMFTGNISRRDEYLVDESKTGLTLEFIAQIHNRRIQSQYESFTAYFVGTDRSYALYLSPNCLKIKRIESLPNMTDRSKCVTIPGVAAKSLDTTKMNTYRVISKPGTDTVDVYVNGSYFLSGKSSPIPFVKTYAPGTTYHPSDAEYEFPYILIGDNFGSSKEAVATNVDASAAYTIDAIRYSRGVFVPGKPVMIPSQSSGYFKKRVPPVLPANKILTSPGLEFASTSMRSLGGFTVEDIGNSQKALHVSGRSKNFSKESLEEIKGNGSWVVESKLKVGALHTEKSFAINMIDRIGMVNLIFSKNSVRLAYGGKYFAESNPVHMDTTNNFHTYTIVRKANDPYVYLYIDNNPVPAIADFKMSMVQFNGVSAAKETRLMFGNFGQVMPTSWSKDVNGEYRGENKEAFMDVYISHIRWAPGQ